jgi:hypothetical protein
MKGVHFSPETEFKPGHSGTRTCDLGTVTIRKDKSGNPRAWVKVSTPDVWVPRAVLNWIASGNSIPSGCVVHHDNRDTLDDSLSNLRCGDRASHLEEHREEHMAIKLAKRQAAEEVQSSDLPLPLFD